MTGKNPMHVPLLALQREYAEVEPQLAGMWEATLSAMRLLKGENLDAFEAEIAAYVGSSLAVGVASGTDALALSLIAVGVGPGDEVLLQASGFGCSHVRDTGRNGADPGGVPASPAAAGGRWLPCAWGAAGRAARRHVRG